MIDLESIVFKIVFDAVMCVDDSSIVRFSFFFRSQWIVENTRHVLLDVSQFRADTILYNMCARISWVAQVFKVQNDDRRSGAIMALSRMSGHRTGWTAHTRKVRINKFMFDVVVCGGIAMHCFVFVDVSRKDFYWLISTFLLLLLIGKSILAIWTKCCNMCGIVLRRMNT